MNVSRGQPQPLPGCFKSFDSIVCRLDAGIDGTDFDRFLFTSTASSFWMLLAGHSEELSSALSDAW